MYSNRYNEIKMCDLETVSKIRSHIMDQQAIEKIQRRAIKLSPELKYDSYQERLSKISLPSLVYGRSRGDMIYIFISVNQPIF